MVFDGMADFPSCAIEIGHHRLFHPVVESWHMQLPDDQHYSNEWVLHNCFTEHIKKLPPNVRMRATVRLGKFFGLGKKATV
jgi:hypothetical protein